MMKAVANMLDDFKLRHILKKWAKLYKKEDGQPITYDNRLVLLPLLRTVSRMSSEPIYNNPGEMYKSSV